MKQLPFIWLQVFPVMCLLFPFSLKAQISAPGYTVVNYNSDNALPQNSINDMAFDGNGFLWLATEMGMVRFDGKNFREYNTSNSPALKSNRCAMVNAVKGQIFIEPVFASHRFLTVTKNYQLKEDPILSSTPYKCNRPNNCIFLYDRIYKKWEHDSLIFHRILNRLNRSDDLLTENEYAAYVKRASGYYYLNENTVDIQPLREIEGHSMKIQFMVGDMYLHIDRQNRLHAYREGQYQQHITCSPGLLKIFSEAESGAYPEQYTLAVLRDAGHSFLVYKGDIFLLHIINGELNFTPLVTRIGIKNINCLLFNELPGTLYIGTATGGLYILKKHEFTRLFFSSDHYAINSLYAQVELPGGRMLTSSGVLNRNNKLNVPDPGSYNRPAMLLASDGHIWYSSNDSLKRIDTGLHHNDAIQYIGSWLTSMTEMVNHDLLFSTVHKLFRFHKDRAVVLLDHPPLLHDAEIQVIREMAPNELWIGTAAGLFRYNLVTGALIEMPGMYNKSVRALFRAKDQTVWIGTYGQGFYKYEDGRFIKMPFDAGKHLATVHCFMEDGNGFFWIPTNKGLFRAARQELENYAAGKGESIFYYYFDKTSGFATNEFNGGCTPCGLVTHDSLFSLPSLDGLILFKPENIPIEIPVHPIFIERMAAGEDSVLPGGSFRQRQDDGPLQFQISSPYFGNPANLQLEYSLPQLDQKWRKVQENGRLVFTGLHKGDYSLLIRKLGTGGRYVYTSVQWTILPFWYETVWFRSLAAVMIIGGLFLIFWLQYTRSVRRAVLLEQKVAERTEALMVSSRVKEKMIAIILHDLRSPLRFLHMLADHVRQNYRRLPGREIDEMMSKICNSTQDLNDFTKDFLTWSQVQMEGFVVQRECIRLHEIVEGIVSLYESAAVMHNNKLINQTAPGVTFFSDPDILKLIIRNLIDNANKHMEGGEISIEAQQDLSSVTILITDTGKSMDKEVVNRILNNTYQSPVNNQGLGYKIIMELMAKLHGRISIEQPGKKGNRIVLIFPA